MAQYYVVALMETKYASKRQGIGYRSFWACHSGPYPTRVDALFRAGPVTEQFRLRSMGAYYYCVDAFPVTYEELSIYGFGRKSPNLQVLLPGQAEVG